MMHRQLPVYSPLSLRAVLASLAGGVPDVCADITRYLGPDAVLPTCSGTAALTAAIGAALQLRPGRPVAMPAYACFDLITAARGAGARIQLYDVNPHSLQPDAGSLLRALGHEPSAVVFVHLYGVPVNLANWQRPVRDAGALLIEDAAQAAGATVGGVSVGTQGDLGVLSFGRGKGVTSGGGGAVVARAYGPLTDAVKMQLKRAPSASALFVGKLMAQWVLGRPSLYGIPAGFPALGLGETRYREPEDVRAMGGQSARVLKVTLRLAATERAVRRENVRQLHARLSDCVRARIPALEPGCEPSWLRLPYLGGEMPDGSALGCVRGYPLALNQLAEARDILVDNAVMPGAAELTQSLWTIPVHSRIREADRAAIAAWMELAVG